MSGKNWVILVAGTKGWDNYRDQANVCSAYQIIRKHGIPEEQIVVMMYDDIAYNDNNPYKGNIVSGLDNSNVYQSVPKDYTGKNVTPKNFLGVLQGNASATAGGKVITSGSQDNIFIYMSGTGQEDKFDFPEKSLLVSDFIKAIEYMSESEKFSKMVIYMESTYSSLMFNDLSDATNAYAVTSGDSSPSNKNDNLGVLLSDEFSTALLDIFSRTDYKASTFKNLNDFIQKKVPVCEFGDKTISSCFLSNFLERH